MEFLKWPELYVECAFYTLLLINKALLKQHIFVCVCFYSHTKIKRKCVCVASNIPIL